ncbi:MAG: EamA family transporter [Chitinophagaceae bacterium]|nr:EamA family transporter [Chitinophagaceae bacterium]
MDTGNRTPATSPATIKVILAFAIVYIVWGSTYYFIKEALDGFPPFILGALRFVVAGLLILIYAAIKGEHVFDKKLIPRAAISGILMLFVGNGMVIWVEQFLSSAMAAIMVSSAAFWFVILDKPKWKANFSNTNIILGLLFGFFGVILLFWDKLSGASLGRDREALGMLLLSFSVIAWAGGSLYSKYFTSGSPIVNTGWQVLAAGVAFLPGMFITNEPGSFNLGQVSPFAWASLIYLILIGSIAAYSAYVWLLANRPATQVSTYAYVNPVVAVLLGVLFAGERITLLPVIGLAVILGSVLLLNLSAYRRAKRNRAEAA